MSSSSSAIGNGAHKGRFNKESVWEACQFGSCSPKESTGAKPWIQACLTTAQSISSIVIQGQGDVDNLAKVTEFSLKYSTVSSGTFFGYKHSNLLQVSLLDIFFSEVFNSKIQFFFLFGLNKLCFSSKKRSKN